MESYLLHHLHLSFTVSASAVKLLLLSDSYWPEGELLQQDALLHLQFCSFKGQT